MKKPTGLYYICHVDNLTSILDKGIYSREHISNEGTQHKDIHNPEILKRRNRQLPNKKNLHEYVNLYFQPRNAMLYRLICNIGRKELAILQISPSILDQEGAWCSDRNAAASNAQFFPTSDGLQEIDNAIFSKEYWTDSDDTKQKMMAEVLVPNVVNPGDIISIYACRTDDVLSRAVKGKKLVVQEPRMFFAPQYNKKLSDTIFLSKGDMFFSSMQTFTISVNTKGIMGKGLASRAKYQFPDAYVRYQDDCKHGKLKIGKPTLYKRAIQIEKELADDTEQLEEENLNGARWFLFFPTKRHWRENSKLDDIEKSMQWLVKNHQKEGIQSIALPALGCGLGNLHWKEVGPVMCSYLQQLNIRSCIYLPMEEAKPLPDEYLSPDYLLQK